MPNRLAKEQHNMSLDSGLIVVIMISMMYMVLVFGLLFYVKNDWCDLLFKNFTVPLTKLELSLTFWENPDFFYDCTITIL
jgi:hypothetical protein